MRYDRDSRGGGGNRLVSQDTLKGPIPRGSLSLQHTGMVGHPGGGRASVSVYIVLLE